MKKTLVAVLSVSVVLLFAASAFALHAVKENFEYTPAMVKAKKAQLEIGGHIRVRGEFKDNTSTFNSDVSSDNSISAFDQRARFHIKATVSPQTMGMLDFEANASQSGDSYSWANCSAAKGIYGKGNCKPSGVTLRQAYIVHQTDALGVMSGFKVGHMLVALGNGMFYNHTQHGDDAIVLWMDPTDGMEVSLNALKLDENTSAFSDDVDAYVATFSGAFGPANVSADVTFLNDNAFDTGKTGNNRGLDFWNIGARTDIKAGPVAIKADVEIQTGTAKESYMDVNGKYNDRDFSGYAFLLGADINAGPVKISAGGAYGSGDKCDYSKADPDNSSMSYGGNACDSEDKYEGFVTSLSSGQRYTYLYDQKVKTAAGASNTGLANTWYLTAGVSAKPMSDLKVQANAYWLRASQATNIGGALNSDGTQQTSKKVGVEFDGKVSYQIDTNLVWYVEAGYLFAGDAYDVRELNANGTYKGNGQNQGADNPYSIRNGIVLKF